MPLHGKNLKRSINKTFKGISARTLNEYKWVVLASKKQLGVSTQLEEKSLLEKAKKY